MPIDKPVRSARASTTRIELPDKTIISVPPVTIEQVRRCMRLDPDEGHVESDREYVNRVAEQFEILVGAEHAHLTQTLTIPAVEQIVRVLFVAGCGLDVEQCALLQAVEHRTAQRRTNLEKLRDLDAATVSLAAELKIRPSEVADMSLAECASMRAEIAKLTKAETSFQAALHGIKL